MCVKCLWINKQLHEKSIFAFTFISCIPFLSLEKKNEINVENFNVIKKKVKKERRKQVNIYILFFFFCGVCAKQHNNRRRAIKRNSKRNEKKKNCVCDIKSLNNRNKI